MKAFLAALVYCYYVQDTLARLPIFRTLAIMLLSSSILARGRSVAVLLALQLATLLKLALPLLLCLCKLVSG